MNRTQRPAEQDLSYYTESMRQTKLSCGRGRIQSESDGLSQKGVKKNLKRKRSLSMGEETVEGQKVMSEEELRRRVAEVEGILAETQKKLEAEELKK